MNRCVRPRVLIFAVLFAAGLAALLPSAAPASDHDDTPLLKTAPRHDARITDLFAFRRGSNLVMAICLDPTIPTTVTNYQFAADLTVTINIDNNQHVHYNNPQDVAQFGGTILHPDKIKPRISFTFTFDNTGTPHMDIDGLRPHAAAQVQRFVGLRDDPFIRGPRIGRNVGAIVLEMPLAHVVQGNKPLLIWGTSRVDDFIGPFHELAGRSLRSQFVENDALNSFTPAQHATELGVTPDVIIYKTSLPAAFPNGRELTDDVVDLVGDPRVLGNDAPFPSANDVPFLTTFPYLAPPHAAP